MGIQVEFNPDLALRVFKTPGRNPSECLPGSLEGGMCYEFQKSGQRVYWLKGEIPLRETKGNEQLSKPIASIRILHYTHKLIGEEIQTRGLYEVTEVFDQEDQKPKFNGLDRIIG